MEKKKIILTALIVSVIGFSMIISSVSKLYSFGQLIFFAIGLGLLIGPIVGITLSILNKNNKK